jgi:biotin carboxylase
MIMERLGIIGTGYMARTIATRAKELCIETHCFSIDDHSVAAEVADYYHHVNILDVNLLVKACMDANIDGVVATTELTIWPTSVVAANLGLNGNDVNVAHQITNKYLVRNKVKRVTSLFQPQFWVCYNRKIPIITKYPVIVKPIAAGGKRGITVVDSPDQIAFAIDEAQQESKGGGVLIEEYLDLGQEYSVESLSYHGNQHIIQITQKDSSGPPHCVELGHHQPAQLTDEMRTNVETVVSGALDAVGITNGPCHTEIKIINEKIYLIEINGRPGGDHIAYPLTELSTGYPYTTGIIMVALNHLDEAQLSNFQKNYCGVYFVTTQTAFLKEVFDTCETKPWFYKKNKVSDDLSTIKHNDGYNTNYFMYYSRDMRPVIKHL